MSYKNARVFHSSIVGMASLQRQAPFLRSVLRAADANKRKQLLQLANADQINTISELILNVIKGDTPSRSRYTIERLKPHAEPLRQMSKMRSSIKRRRQAMIDQTGSGLWKELQLCHRRLMRLLRP